MTAARAKPASEATPGVSAGSVERRVSARLGCRRKGDGEPSGRRPTARQAASSTLPGASALGTSRARRRLFDLAPKTHLENPGIAVIETRLHPDVVAFLKTKMEDLTSIEAKYGKKIYLFPVRELPINRAEFACYDHRGEKVVDFIK